MSIQGFIGRDGLIASLAHLARIQASAFASGRKTGRKTIKTYRKRLAEEVLAEEGLTVGPRGNVIRTDLRGQLRRERRRGEISPRQQRKAIKAARRGDVA